MLFAIMFAFWRFMEILTLVPIVGMLSYFVNINLSSNLMTPTSILVLFIVSVLALAWAIFTLFSYHRSSNNAQFVGFIDLCLFGALIAGVYYLRGIANADCSSGAILRQNGWVVVSVNVDKTCAMLKACFAMGIMNVIFFFITAVMAWVHGRHSARDEKVRYVETRRVSRSRGGSRSSRRSRSYSGSRSRGGHSHHRAYV
ncbi:hypothetical protein QBC36DRAFT_344559 [Triangularia setosa]|uniref:MARVEL domain-containing protein n=1 Tax=Triangularia setosa TaxID=2587417 RepID=A0AAN6WBH6_9PEZI|nr:hypothetical protein QBC36DRAFT_344559 [Podospora setosa]